MHSELIEENPRGDLLQQIDDTCGPQIEKAVQKWLPRDIAKKIRGRVIHFIGEEVRPSSKSQEVVSGSTD